MSLPSWIADRYGDYEPTDPLASGGQGDVLLARHFWTGEVAALKLVWLGPDPIGAEVIRGRVRRETQALADIAHPAVARVLGSGESTASAPREPFGCMYVAYELIEGRCTLHRLLRERRAPEFSTCALMLTRLGEGLTRLHAKGVFHRDIKPQNIMLRGGDARDPVWIDLGYAKVQGATTLTAPFVLPGTIGYLPPEAAHMDRRPSTADQWGRYDQWAFAKVMAETFAVAAGHLLDEFVDERGDVVLRTLGQHHTALTDILRRALSPDPAARFPSIDAFTAAAAAALAFPPAAAPLSVGTVTRLVSRISALFEQRVAPVSFSSRELILTVGGASLFRRRSQLVLMEDSMGRTHVGVACRNEPARNAAVRMFAHHTGAPVVHGLATACPDLQIAIWDRSVTGSEPGAGVTAAAFPLVDAFAKDGIARRDFLRKIETSRAGVFFIRSGALTPMERATVLNGDTEPIMSVLRLWRLLLAFELPPRVPVTAS